MESCKEAPESGVYAMCGEPEGYQAYCDTDRHGGGWTLLMKAVPGARKACSCSQPCGVLRGGGVLRCRAPPEGVGHAVEQATPSAGMPSIGPARQRFTSRTLPQTSIWTQNTPRSTPTKRPPSLQYGQTLTITNGIAHQQLWGGYHIALSYLALAVWF